MDFINILLGIGAIILGIALIIGYERFAAKNGSGGLSFKIRTAGIGAIIIGFYLLAKELSKII